MTKQILSLHSYYRNQISTIDEWLDHVKDIDDDDLVNTVSTMYPVQSTALLYEEYLTCQEEK